MSERTYQASVNDHFVFDAINPNDLDFTTNQDGSFHILHEQKAYRAQVLSVDHINKIFRIKVNGKVYPVKLADQYDQLVSSLGLHAAANTAIKEIKAPMPGLVLEINVNEGDQIKKGDPVLILEAMKMENVIKAPGDTIIETIKVKQGEAVEKNQVLVKLG